MKQSMGIQRSGFRKSIWERLRADPDTPSQNKRRTSKTQTPILDSKDRRSLVSDFSLFCDDDLGASLANPSHILIAASCNHGGLNVRPPRYQVDGIISQTPAKNLE
jgi:hypothetical protein